MKIFLTGVAGFIGSHTARALLKRGDEVIGFDCLNDYYSVQVKQWNIGQLERDFPNSFRFVRGDILDKRLLAELFEKEKFEKVCHLAARAGVRPSIANPFLYEEVNVVGTLNLLEIARQYAIENFVYASSSSVYGECEEVPFYEDVKLDRPISPYAASKKSCEQYAYTYSHLYGLPTIGLRFFTVYGPAGRPDMAPYLFTKWIDEGVPVRRFGDGSTSRDYTYIDDIVHGVIASLDLETKYEIFNLGNSSPVELNTLIATIEACLGKKSIIEQLSMQPGDVSRTYANIDHAQKLLDYVPCTSLQQGMEGYVRWYLQHKELYR